MDKIEFKKFCDCVFKKYGFIKTRKGYYLNGNNGVLCNILLQKSDYSHGYYINFYFFLGTYDSVQNYPDRYDLDVQGRFLVTSKSRTKNGKYITDTLIEYENYTMEELQTYFNQEFDKRIIPPIMQGKKYILENLGKLYFLTLHQEEVLRKLQK